MVTVYLVRHAQSVMNTRRCLVGGRSNHTPLTQQGRQQATLCGQALRTRGIRPQVLYVSPAVRTQQTAQLLRAGLGVDVPMHTDDRLQELSQGSWTGRPRVLVYNPVTLAAIAAQGLDFAAPGGESMRQVGARMYAWLLAAQAQAAQQGYSSIMAVSHGIAIKSLVGYVANWSHSKIYTTELANVSLTQLECRGPARRDIRVVAVGKAMI